MVVAFQFDYTQLSFCDQPPFVLINFELVEQHPRKLPAIQQLSWFAQRKFILFLNDLRQEITSQGIVDAWI